VTGARILIIDGNVADSRAANGSARLLRVLMFTLSPRFIYCTAPSSKSCAAPMKVKWPSRPGGNSRSGSVGRGALRRARGLNSGNASAAGESVFCLIIDDMANGHERQALGLRQRQ